MTHTLTPRERLIIATLYAHEGAMKADALDLALPGACDRDALNSLKVQITRIRNKLGRDFIVSPGYGKGYALSERAREAWKNV